MHSLSHAARERAITGLFAIALAAVLLLSGAGHLLDGWHQQRLPLMGQWVSAQFTAMALMMLLAWWATPLLLASSNRVAHANLLPWPSPVWWLVFVGILARLWLFGVDPYTSNDVDRYLFDGRVALTGLDPYLTAHDHPALAHLRAIWQPPAEHAKYPTLYPPLAMALFSLCAAAGAIFGVEYAQLAWQGLVVAASITSLLLVVRILEKAGKIQHLALVALSPLLILEAGVGLHLDALSTLAVVAAVYAWQHRRPGWAGVFVGLGVLIKLLPLMLLLPLLLLQPSLARFWRMAGASVLTVVAGYASLLLLGLRPFGSLGVFFEKWRFGSPLYTAFESTLGGQGMALLSGGLILVAVLLIAVAAFKRRWLIRGDELPACVGYCLQLALALPLLISPVVFPWYLSPLVPLLALAPNPYLLAWLIAAPLSYEVLDGFVHDGTWMPATWPVWLVAAIFAATLVRLVYQPLSAWRSARALPLPMN